MSENLNTLKTQLEVARNEIHNLRQQLIALNHIQRKEIENIYKKLEHWECLGCKNRQEIVNEISTLAESNSTHTSTSDLQLKCIGKVRTHFPEKRGTPRQPAVSDSTVAKLILSNDVFTNPDHALEGLKEYSHMWILFYFHKNNNEHTRAKVAPPRLNGVRTGVFATRSPNRPTPIGLSLVKIDRVIGNTIYFRGVDMIDKTPVLDVKPYIPHYDNPELMVFHDSAPESTDAELETNSILDITNNSNLLNITDDREESARIMDGEETERHNTIILGGTSQNTSIVQESFERSASRFGEREDPDGEEEEVTTVGAQSSTVSTSQVRVPSWIDQSPVPRLLVVFKDRALAQLGQLGQEGEQKKTTITSVLKEDPRSVYLRERWGSHCYVFRIAELFVSCKFNDANQTVTVYQVFQNEGPPEPDE